MSSTYIIVDDNKTSALRTKELADRFNSLVYLTTAYNYEEGLDAILEHRPHLVFLEIDPEDVDSGLSLNIISEMYRFLMVIPKIIITTREKSLAYDALQFEVVDYLLKPLVLSNFRKSILKMERATFFDSISAFQEGDTKTMLSTNNQNNAITISSEQSNLVVGAPEKVQYDNDNTPTELESSSMEEEKEVEISVPLTVEENENNEQAGDLNVESNINNSVDEDDDDLIVINPNLDDNAPLTICVKSYGDYRYIDAGDILYFAADNNSTDIHLNDGEMITAFKTLKHFETILPTSHFLRIHNSHIINIHQISRIHTGNSVCYIKNSTTKLPFSKSYKDNVDLIISRIASGNYIEV